MLSPIGFEFLSTNRVFKVNSLAEEYEDKESLMDDFILDYLESNTKNEAPKREYKSRFIRPTPLAPINRN